MKTPTSRTRTLASWALAGTLGLAGPAMAQISSYAPTGTGNQTDVRVESSAPAKADSQVRLEAIQIELAWLADPTTFSSNLGVYPVGSTLEVRGFVPTEAVRTHALKLARANTRRKVTDSVKIYPNMAARSASETPETLVKTAADALAPVLGERARSLTIRAQSSGQITVTGSVSSYEEKLAVSRQLRQVRGCTGVANDLTVVTVLRDGKLYHQVTADARQRVPAHNEILHVNHSTPQKPSPPTTPPQSIMAPATAPTVRQPATASAGSPASPPTTTRPMTTPSTPSGAAVPPNGTGPVRPAGKPPAPLVRTSFENAPELKPTVPAGASSGGDSSPPTGPRVVMVKTLETVPGSIIPVERMVPVLLSGTDRLQATRTLSPEEAAMAQRQAIQRPGTAATTAPVTSRPTTTPIMPSPPTTTVPRIESPAPASRPVINSEPKPVDLVPAKPNTPATVPSVSAPPLVNPTLKPVSTPATQPTIVPIMPAVEKQEPISNPSRLTPTTSLMLPRNTVDLPPLPPTAARPQPGLTTVAAANPKPSAVPAVHSQTPNMPAAPKTEPVAPRTLVMPAPEAIKPAAAPKQAAPGAPYVAKGVVTFEEEAPAAPPTASKLSLGQLRSRIESACAGTVRDVAVTARSEKHLFIQLKVATATEAPKVSEKVLNLPELAPYEIDLDVHVAP